MSEIATVRAQIKAWERSFKDINGRPPTVDDIKQNPNIADKYKQYKKLSRAATSSNTTQASKPVASPSTPLRKKCPKDSTTLLLPKSRPIQPPTPLASFNPFSPQKKRKGKERETESVNKIDEHNPFVQPDLTKRVRKVSPDLFPVLQHSRLSSATSSLNFDLNPPLLSASAVSRARKRLRGEPVSPSPNKDKRRRVASQTTLPFSRLKWDAPSIDDNDDNLMDVESSFVDNSPMKAPIPGKSYQQLFEENTMPTNLFWIEGMDEAARNGLHSASTVNGHLKPLQRAMAPKQDSTDLATDNLDHTNSRKMSSHPIEKTALDSQSEFSINRPSSKRAFLDEEGETEVILPREKSPLIPPSPPPVGSNASFNKPGKSRANAKGIMSRKKMKTDNQTPADDDSDDHESKSKLRIIGRNAVRRQHASILQDEEVVTSDCDPILDYTRFTTPRASSQDNAQLQEGNVEIDLPDELRRVLALQPVGSRSQVSEEDRLVKGLLYGRRTNHYDPQKGGEIWDVGEDHHVDENEGNTEGEDDWEGEPVPWEVGEL
ncbi:hypothetical protein CVT25_005703 [Psilocybe cyanescens]|uniref:DNA replication regulator SLD2 n=1 Tax=Psilocybe cyanescens TaxID=93625 RepID=A0A409VLF7_PSICY|nr:hypothetical protein CVT25_005703 [Psilocybe cyanescens]